MTNPPNAESPGEEGATPESNAPTDGAPGTTPPAPGNGQPQTPQAPVYGQPQAPQYGQPQAPQYGQPQAPQYGQPQAPGYGQPQAPQYGQPQSGQPQAPQYGQPQYGQPQYGQPQYAQQPSPAGPYPPAGPGEPFDGAVSPDDLTRPLYGASFSQAVKRFFKSYAKFSGRASRSEYWWVALFSALATLIPGIIYITGGIMMGLSAPSSPTYYDDSYSYDSDPFGPASSATGGVGLVLFIIGIGLLLIITFGLLVPSIAVTWRRLHDANFAGPFFFLGCIPYVGGLILLVFTVMSPNPTGRRFDVR